MPALVAVALDQRTAAVVVLGPVRGGLRSVLEHRRCDVGELSAYLRRLADLHGSPRAGAWGCATTTEAAAVRTLLALLAVLARRGRPTMDEHRAACRARLWLDERLKEGRVEAAEVRYALGLPMTATRHEVVAAIKTRAT